MAAIVISDSRRIGDQVTVDATVDGAPVTVTFWWSHLNGLSTTAAKVAYIAGLAKAAIPAVLTAVPLATTTTA